jgi:membrane protease YdiL (CAAX protease family)
MQFQWLLLLLFLALPALDHFVIYRGFERRCRVDAPRARRLVWLHWAAMLWVSTGLVAALWVAQALPAAALGFVVAGDWRLWAVVGFASVLLALQVRSASKLARFSGDRTRLRERLGSTGPVMPHTSSELPLWYALSITAGLCEEVLFRGFLIWILAPLLGWWGGAAVSVVVFATGHAYQGKEGLVRSSGAAVLFTFMFWFTGSIWPGILIHALVDIVGGTIGYLILRDPVEPTIADATGRTA